MMDVQVNNTTQSHSALEGSFINPATQITLYVILLVWSLVGNALVIIVLILNKKLRSTFNHLILNMAASDLAVPLLALPIKIAEEASTPPGRWLVEGEFGNVLCKVSFLLADSSPAVSVFSLLIIAIERFVVTLYPIRRYMITKRLNYFCIGCTWIVSIILMSPNLYIFKTSVQNGHTFCYWSWSPDFDESSSKVFALVVFIVGFAIPFLTIVALYYIMVYKLRQNNQTVKENMLHQACKAESKRQKNTRTVFYISISICVSFAVLWGPFFCILFAHYFIVEVKNPVVIFVINYLAFVNSAINPCIYFLFLKSFRSGLARLFGKRQDRNTTVISTRVREERNDRQESQL